MLTTDIHLARLAPELFIDAADLATILVEGSDGSIAATTLTSASADFESDGINSGHVIVVNGTILEIVARSGANELEISRPRTDDADDAIAPAAGSDLAFTVRSFARLIAQAESWVLGALGIDASDPQRPLDPDSIVNIDDLANLIAVRTIALAYDRAAARSADDAAMALQASHWRAVERRERARTVAYLDLDDDGIPDATRRIDVVALRRA